MNRIFKLIAAAAVMTAACGAVAQNVLGNRWIGIQGGVYIPTNRTIRDVFGSNVFSFGPSVFAEPHYYQDWKITTSFDLIHANRSGSHFTLVPVTAGFEKTFGNPGDEARPFVRAAVGAAYFDYGLTLPGTTTRVSGHKIGPTGSIEAGAVLSNRLRLVARYNLFGKQDGLNFSGLQIAAEVAVFKF